MAHAVQKLARTHLDPGVVEDGEGRELPVDGAGGDGEDPRRDVGDGAEVRAVVAGGADDSDAGLDGVERADGETMPKDRVETAPEEICAMSTASNFKRVGGVFPKC